MPTERSAASTDCPACVDSTCTHGEGCFIDEAFGPTDSEKRRQEARSAATTLLGIEFKSEKFYDGWTWSEGATDFVQTAGVCVLWRREGERRWRKQSILCDEGQTPESLSEHLPEIVRVLVERAA